jgi:hypothetical protein
MVEAVESPGQQLREQFGYHIRREKSFMISINSGLRLLASLLAPLLLGTAAFGANSFSNSLTGFTGDSTQPATVSAVAAAGFNFSNDGVGAGTPPPASAYKVQYDATGAKFGVGQPVNDGRNYMRTVATDYANTSFVAEVTFTETDLEAQNAYFGLGSGDANNDFFRTPDRGTAAASIMYWGESEIATPTVQITINNDTQSRDISETPAPGLGNGTHRVRLAFDWFAKTATFAFDLNYAGGAFAADVTSPAANVLPLYSSGTGFPLEPGRIYLGGDLGTVFKDFAVTVSGPSVVYGDLDNNGTITASDWAVLRSNRQKDLSGFSLQQSYFAGDLTADLKNDHDDFVIFKTLYEANNGAGSFNAMLASTPEPSTISLLLISGLVLGLRAGRRMPTA